MLRHIVYFVSFDEEKGVCINDPYGGYVEFGAEFTSRNNSLYNTLYSDRNFVVKDLYIRNMPESEWWEYSLGNNEWIPWEDVARHNLPKWYLKLKFED